MNLFDWPMHCLARWRCIVLQQTLNLAQLFCWKTLRWHPTALMDWLQMDERAAFFHTRPKNSSDGTGMLCIPSMQAMSRLELNAQNYDLKGIFSFCSLFSTYTLKNVIVFWAQSSTAAERIQWRHWWRTAAAADVLLCHCMVGETRCQPFKWIKPQEQLF